MKIKLHIKLLFPLFLLVSAISLFFIMPTKVSAQNLCSPGDTLTCSERTCTTNGLRCTLTRKYCEWEPIYNKYQWGSCVSVDECTTALCQEQQPLPACSSCPHKNETCAGVPYDIERDCEGDTLVRCRGAKSCSAPAPTVQPTVRPSVNPAPSQNPAPSASNPPAATNPPVSGGGSGGSSGGSNRPTATITCSEDGDSSPNDCNVTVFRDANNNPQNPYNLGSVMINASWRDWDKNGTCTDAGLQGKNCKFTGANLCYKVANDPNSYWKQRGARGKSAATPNVFPNGSFEGAEGSASGLVLPWIERGKTYNVALFQDSYCAEGRLNCINGNDNVNPQGTDASGKGACTGNKLAELTVTTNTSQSGVRFIGYTPGDNLTAVQNSQFPQTPISPDPRDRFNSFNYTFTDSSAGTKTLFVKFFYSDGRHVLRQASIIYQPVAATTACNRCSTINAYQRTSFNSQDATCARVVPSSNPVTRTCDCSCPSANLNTSWDASCISTCQPSSSANLLGTSTGYDYDIGASTQRSGGQNMQSATVAANHQFYQFFGSQGTAATPGVYYLSGTKTGAGSSIKADIYRVGSGSNARTVAAGSEFTVANNEYFAVILRAGSNEPATFSSVSLVRR